jgi:hypothetical protein
MRPLSRICMTSEATARACNLAAAIWSAESSLLPATVRALIVHSADWTKAMVEQFANLDERIAIAGMGVPDPFLAVACAADRATVVFEDTMPNAVAVRTPQKQPLPADLVSSGEKHLRRVVKFFRLPVPEEALLADPQRTVELR